MQKNKRVFKIKKELQYDLWKEWLLLQQINKQSISPFMYEFPQ